jgi:hypothetical protein
VTPETLRKLIADAFAEGKTSATLKGIVERIVALKPQRGGGQ